MTQVFTAKPVGIKTIFQTLNSPWVLILASPILIAILDPGNLVFIVRSTIESLPFISVAVLLIAFLRATNTTSLIVMAFKGHESRMIVLASLVGGLAPFCACEVIPFIAALLIAVIPLSAIMAFWLSSPLMDPPTFFITTAALGWEFATGKTIAAVALGLLVGFTTKICLCHQSFIKAPLRKKLVSEHCCSDSQFQSGSAIWKFWEESKRRHIFRIQVLSNSLFLLKWLSLAYLIQALLVSYFPTEWIAGLVGGNGLQSIVFGALVGAPAYLNGYAAPALVSGLIEQGMSSGAAMAFIVAGAISCIPAMVAVWSLVNYGVFLAYFGFGIFSAILSGVSFSLIVG